MYTESKERIVIFLKYIFLADPADPCSLNPCDPNADCENDQGTHKCTCKDGYSGDGETCTGKNSVQLNRIELNSFKMRIVQIKVPALYMIM